MLTNFYSFKDHAERFHFLHALAEQARFYRL